MKTTDETEYGFYQKDPARPIDVMPEPTFRRVPVMPALQRVRAAEELANPHFKCSRGAREALHHLRNYVLKPIEPQEPKLSPVKFALKLTTLRLTQLIRQQKKWAREASTAKHILADMDPDSHSRLKSRIRRRQDDCLARLGQITAEIKARALACEGRLAETTE